MVYVSSMEQLVYEKIVRDEAFWTNTKTKLNDFYHQCMLPGLIDPNRPCLNTNHKKT